MTTEHVSVPREFLRHVDDLILCIEAFGAAKVRLCHDLIESRKAILSRATPSAPRVVTAELSNTLAGDIAEHLRDKGWSSGGDYQDDFLPDVEIATRAALDSFATSLPAAVPDASWFEETLCEARNIWCRDHEDRWLETDENHPDAWIGSYLRTALLAAAPQAGETK